MTMSRELFVDVSHHHDAGCAVVTVTGDIDRTSSPLLRGAVDRLVSGGQAHIILDVEGVTFCDSTGLRTFLSGVNTTYEAGGWLRLAGVSGHLERLLQITDLYTFFAIDTDVARSLASARTRG
ncbi:STAS domain-containing protein [Streptosporangium sp. NPDC004379]|uniref:STAS domain-containing protein n=1 Tax=Streptosporangium sp. NPDC004379 TaxID=3366189 RepID=UPI00369F116E